MENMETVLERLRSIPGVVACWVLPQTVRNPLMRLEIESNLRLGLPGIPIVNEGIKAVLHCQHVVAICHSPELRHPPGPVVVICGPDEIVAEEIFEPERLRQLSADPNMILFGKSLVFYRDALKQAAGKPLRLCYMGLPFPELEEVEGIRDVISVTVGYTAHFEVAKNAGWNPNDPNLGTVLIGFNQTSNKD